MCALTSLSRRLPYARRVAGHRRGSVLVLSLFLMMVLLALIALGVESGYMYAMKGRLQRSVDSAALAGAGSLVDGEQTANASVVEYMLRNPVTPGHVVVSEEELEGQISSYLTEHEEELEITLGHWNIDERVIEPTVDLPSAVSVTMVQQDLPLFFGTFAGRDRFTISATSIATYQPRDIMVILDFSASMNDDSELRSISTLGQDSVEENIEKMWDDLGNPTYGNLQFDPQWVTVPGVSLPFSVTWRSNAIDIEATTNMQQVKLFFSNGSSQKFKTSQSSGTWSGTGNLNGNRITGVRVKINGNNEKINFYSNSAIIRGLGLDTVSYPYNSGNWGDFVEYCRSHSSSMPWYDYDVYAAGYRRKFGMLTLINFWNRHKPRNSETEDLWMASAQPITAVKDALDVFVEYVEAVPTNDRVGLSIYNSSSGNGVLESGLTFDFDAIVDIARHRQAGHYHHYTNIGAGMQKAREELESNARLGAYKMIVLMTDGKANWINGDYDEDEADEYVLEEAQLAADLGYPIVTISLGAGADTAIMGQVAEITAGTHFNVPGGQSVEEYSEELIDVFEKIATHRPLKIVH